MKTSDFDFDLPQQLLAQYPSGRRGDSRLMLLNRQTGKREHCSVSDLPTLLQTPCFRGSSGLLPLLVFNNSKVRKARLNAKSLRSNVPVEFLLLEEIDNGIWKTLVQRVKRRQPGSEYDFFDMSGKNINRAIITKTENEFCFLKFERHIDDNWLEQYGRIPLPPYIKRPDTPDDEIRYQTVYASITGSAAAPTAGLHFTPELLDKLAEAGIESAFITLHVGLGTFWPVRSANIEEHKMHEEVFEINGGAADKIERAQAEGRKIITVGTTSLRTLESAFNNKLIRGRGKTSIFIYPGYKFKIADALFTNFHTPESTLIMLVSAFACGLETQNQNRGRELIMETYNEAIREGYKFFSYGDAMLIY